MKAEQEDRECPSERAWKSRTDNTTLLRLWQEGDESAREELLRRLAIDARRRHWFGLPTADADDVTQHFLLRLTQSLPKFRFDCSLQSYCAVVARQCHTDRLRRNYHSPSSFDPDTLTLADLDTLTLADLDTAPLLRAGLREYLNPLLRALQTTLTIREYEIIDLVILQGLTYVDVAHSLGVEPSAVRNIVFRARKKLKATFSERYLDIIAK